MLHKFEDGWFRFENGKRWRVKSPHYLCEIGSENNIPDYCKLASALANVRRVKAFYLGKLKFGKLDEFGTAVDILTANAMTESLGTVPSPMDHSDLSKKLQQTTGMDTGSKLDSIVRHIGNSKPTRYLERREPGYINPINTPHRVSLGGHHMLISTALQIKGWSKAPDKEARITELVLTLPTQSLVAAQLAVDYFNKYYSLHHNQLPLLAATYNAGSPRRTTQNDWNLVQYGEHIDRWITYYNTSRKV
ncbi:MAG: hypothetical protein Q8928_00450 [Bacteroidota bacterium]|nr:hypothetical protein [Bacteroidota bacterium]